MVTKMLCGFGTAGRHVVELFREDLPENVGIVDGDRSDFEKFPAATQVLALLTLGGSPFSDSVNQAITWLEMAKIQGLETHLLVTLPFSFEGHERLENARAAFPLLAWLADKMYKIDYDKVIPFDLSHESSFSHADEMLKEQLTKLLSD